MIVLTTLLLATLNMLGLSSSGTTMEVDPSDPIVKSVCETFYINISVTDVKDLRDYRFTLSYDTSILDAWGVENGGFFNQGVYIDYSIKDDIGEVEVRGGSTPPAEPVSGNGTLTTIEFKCTGVGECDLILLATSLEDDDGNPISPTIKNGECIILLERGIPIEVNEDYTLCHDIVFQGCGGFNITGHDIVLDLNGHQVTYQPTGPAPGLTGIEVREKNRVTIKNGTLNNFQYGIWVEDSSGVIISSINVLESTEIGIGIRNSNDVQINSSNISGSDDDGIAIDGNSFGVSILDSNISGSGDVGVGLDGDSSNVSIIHSTISSNRREGIHIKDSNYNIVSNNEVSENRYYGIYSYNSNNNTIDTNTLLNNQPGGMYIESSDDNIIYRNNFINNPKDAECVNSINTWDAGYGTVDCIAFGGNYWTYYNGVDVFSGKNKDVPGCDGIGDIAHTINGNNIDNYPLMEPWGMMLTGCCLSWKVSVAQVQWQVTCHAGVLSDSSPNDFVFNRSAGEITFTVNDGTFCKVIVSEEGLDGAFNVTIDDVPTPCIINWDETHYFIHFTLPSGNHEVRIAGEIAGRLVGDLNEDGEVNIIDIATAAIDFGKKIVD